MSSHESSGRESREDLIERLTPSIVSIELYGQVSDALDPTNFETPQAPHWRQVGGASGFFVSEDGLFATNRHVVERGSDGEEVCVVRASNEEPFESEILYIDPVRDFALGKINGKVCKPLEIGDSNALRKGQEIIVMGSPLGVAGANSVGVVSELPKPAVPGDSPSRKRQKTKIATDADIRPGSSGGPMLNERGEVVGVNTAVDIDRNGSGSVGFAIPISEVKTIIEHPRVFIYMQQLFADIETKRTGEKPVELKPAFKVALKMMEYVLQEEFNGKNPEGVKMIMQDAAVQWYFQRLLQSARSDSYRVEFEKTFGVPLNKKQIPELELNVDE